MADLSQFSIRKNVEDGKIFPVKIKGVKLPIALRIYGSDADCVKTFERQQLRKIGLKQGKDIDEETLEELIENQNEGVYVRIGGIYEYDWKKKDITDGVVTINGKELKNEKNSYELLIDAIPDIRDFVLEKSNERANFLD